jgi:hypothetical protein
MSEKEDELVFEAEGTFKVFCGTGQSTDHSSHCDMFGQVLVVLPGRV